MHCILPPERSLPQMLPKENQRQWNYGIVMYENVNLLPRFALSAEKDDANIYKELLVALMAFNDKSYKK